MGFNRFRWWTYSKKPKKLKKSAPLIDKIRNGDFDLSIYLQDVPLAEQDYKEKYEKAAAEYDTTDEFARHNHAHAQARKRNEARLKLLENGTEDELKVLTTLRNELEKEFGEDLWDDATSVETGLETVEQIYDYYNERT